MIKVTKINGKEILINPDLIEIIEGNPDTVISLTTGNKIIIKESLDEITRRVIEFRSAILKK